MPIIYWTFIYLMPISSFLYFVLKQMLIDIDKIRMASRHGVALKVAIAALMLTAFTSLRIASSLPATGRNTRLKSV